MFFHSRTPPLWNWISGHFFFVCWAVDARNDLIKVKMNLAVGINWQNQMSHQHTEKWNSFLFLFPFHCTLLRKKTPKRKRNRKMHGKRNVVDTSSWFDCCWFSLSRFSVTARKKKKKKIVTRHEIQQGRDPITNHFTCLSSISILPRLSCPSFFSPIEQKNDGLRKCNKRLSRKCQMFFSSCKMFTDGAIYMAISAQCLYVWCAFFSSSAYAGWHAFQNI